MTSSVLNRQSRRPRWKFIIQYDQAYSCLIHYFKRCVCVITEEAKFNLVKYLKEVNQANNSLVITEAEFNLVISRRVNAPPHLTCLNLCIDGAYGPIDSELWLTVARTRPSAFQQFRCRSQENFFRFYGIGEKL